MKFKYPVFVVHNAAEKWLDDNHPSHQHTAHVGQMKRFLTGCAAESIILDEIDFTILKDYLN
jgi:hypothetical protein